MTRRDWTALALCPQCGGYVESRNSSLVHHEYRRLRCPGTGAFERYVEATQGMGWEPPPEVLL